MKKLMFVSLAIVLLALAVTPHQSKAQQQFQKSTAGMVIVDGFVSFTVPANGQADIVIYQLSATDPSITLSTAAPSGKLIDACAYALARGYRVSSVQPDNYSYHAVLIKD